MTSLIGIRNILIALAWIFLSVADSPVLAQKPAPPAVTNQAPAPTNLKLPNKTLKVVEQATPLIPLSERNIRPVTKPFVVVGEVVDAWCYASQTMGSGRGNAHKPCALACIYGGVTPGIVDDKGTLYIAAKHKGYTGCKELLTPFVAQRVKATGWLSTKGGCNVLKIMKVEPAK